MLFRSFGWKKDFPMVNAVSPEYAAQVREKWGGKLAFLRRLQGR